MLSTEKRNQKTMNLDQMSIKEFLTIMNAEDQTVPHLIASLIDDIKEVVVGLLNLFIKVDA